jgi:tetratricopeptide (TPR) repeat protein
MATDRPAYVAHFVHTLLRARNWQERPEFAQVCDWWRAGGKGVLALVGIGGAGKTAIADRFLRSLPGLTEAEPALPQDVTLPLPESLFVFSFYDAPNPESFFDTLYHWLVTEFQLRDRRRVIESGVLTQASVSLVIDALGHTRRKLLLVLDGLEKVQDDGSRTGVFRYLEDGGLRSFLQRVAAGLLPGLAVLVTTRFVLDDLAYEWERGTVSLFTAVSVEEISDTACIALLRHRGVHGGDDVLRAIGRACGRHALTVDLAGGYLVHFHNGDPNAPLTLPTPEELQHLATSERDHQLRHVAEQTTRFGRVAESYYTALSRSDPAALALLQRLCLFRLGADAAILTSIFTGPNKEGVSGSALAALSSDEVQARLNRLIDMRLVERRTLRAIHGSEPGQSAIRNAQSAIYTVRPAVRNGFLSGLGMVAARSAHDAIRTGLLAALGEQPSTHPSAAAMLDLLEEIVYHTLRAGHVVDAWDIYCHRIGGYWNLGWRLGAYERGERLCRGFANGLSSQAALGGDTSFMPFRQLSEHWQATFLNEWALYLKQLGCLDAAACCFKAAHEPDYRHENWTNASTGDQNLAAVWLLSGHLATGLRATAEALRLAERADDATERMTSHAYCGHARAQRGETDTALTDFHDALYWQHQAEGQSDLPLYSLRGVYHTLLLTRLDRHAEALRLTEANKEILLEHGGPQDDDVPKCHLVLADLACKRGDWILARNLCHQAHSWALERDAKEVLCRSALVHARIELDEALAVAQSKSDGTVAQPPNEYVLACRRVLAEGLHIACECGYGIYHIDLLLLQARLALHTGDADAALADVETALTTGHQPPPDSGLPTLLAATDPECGYAWGEAEARHFRAEALLLQAAQYLGRPDFVPATLDQFPGEVRQRIYEAREELTRCCALRQRIRDLKVLQTVDVLNRLNGGQLTRYPLHRGPAHHFHPPGRYLRLDRESGPGSLMKD